MQKSSYREAHLRGSRVIIMPQLLSATAYKGIPLASINAESIGRKCRDADIAFRALPALPRVISAYSAQIRATIFDDT